MQKVFARMCTVPDLLAFQNEVCQELARSSSMKVVDSDFQLIHMNGHDGFTAYVMVFCWVVIDDDKR